MFKFNRAFTPTPILKNRSISIAYRNLLSLFPPQTKTSVGIGVSLHSKRGFTLIELLVVISIISMLSSIVFSSLNDAREKARIAAGMQSEANIVHGIGDQLVGEWKFNEGSGTAVDTSSFNQNGVIHGTTWSGNNGYDGKGSYFFNGAAYIDAVLKPITPTNTVTFTAWVKGTGHPDGAGIISFRGGSVGATGMLVYTNQLRAIWNTWCSMYAYDTGLTIPTDRWNFVAMSVTPTKITLYVNSKSYTYVSSNFCSLSAWPAMNFSSTPLNIGQDYGRYWNGYIDNVRMYQSSLTATEIQQLYAEGLPAHQVAVQ